MKADKRVGEGLRYSHIRGRARTSWHVFAFRAIFSVRVDKRNVFTMICARTLGTNRLVTTLIRARVRFKTNDRTATTVALLPRPLCSKVPSIVVLPVRWLNIGRRSVASCSYNGYYSHLVIACGNFAEEFCVFVSGCRVCGSNCVFVVVKKFPKLVSWITSPPDSQL